MPNNVGTPSTYQMKVTKEFIYASVVFLLILSISQYFAYQQHLFYKKSVDADLNIELKSAEQTLHTLLNHNHTSAYALGLIYHQRFEKMKFDSLAKDLMNANKFVDVVQLNDKGVVTHTYPYVGNESVIGFDVLKDSLRGPDARMAIKTRSMIYSGPLALMQSGEMAIIGRLPIFDHQDQFLGFSVIITKLSTITDFLASNGNTNYNYQFVKIDPATQAITFKLYPDFNYDLSTLKYVDIKEGNWRLYVAPHEYTYEYFISFIIAILGLIIAVSTAVLVHSMLKEPVRLNSIISEKTQQLITSEKYYRKLIESSTDGIILLNAQKQVVYVSPSVSKITNYNDYDLLNKELKNVVHAEDIEAFSFLIDKSLKSDSSDTIKVGFRLLLPDGNFIWVKGICNNLLHDENVKAIVFTFRDVSAKINTQQVLIKYNREISLLNRVNDLVLSAEDEAGLAQDICRCIVEHGGYKLVWIAKKPSSNDTEQQVENEAAYGEIGYLNEIKINLSNAELAKGPTARALLDGKITVLNNVSREPIFSPWQANAQKFGINASLVVPLSFEDGKVTHALNIYSANIDAYDKQEVGILTRVANNISLKVKSIRSRTEKVHAIGLLKERVTELTTIYTINSLLLDKDLMLDDALFAVLNTLVSGMLYPDCCEGKIMLGGRLYTTDGFNQVVNKITEKIDAIDGSESYIEIGCKQICDKDCDFAFVAEEIRLVKNVAELIQLYYNRKYQQEALEKSEANLRSIFHNTDIGYTLLDIHGNIIAFNQIMYKVYNTLTGFKLNEGGSFFKVLQEQRVSVFRQAVNHVLDTHTNFEYQTQYFDKTSNQEVYYAISVVPILNQRQVIGICMSAVDITKVKKFEQERQVHLNQLLQRNKDLEQFAYIVSHNLRSPLTNIMGLVQFMNINQSDEEKEFVKQSIQLSVHRLDSVVKDLNMILDVRQDLASQVASTVNLAVAVDRVALSIENQIAESKTTLITNFESGDLVFAIDAYVDSIFLNLITNSIKYAQANVNPIITLTSAIEKDYLVVKYQDNGIGIDLDKFGDQVFGFYKRFTNKSEGKGLGLFLIKNHIESMGGSIKILSKPQEGTLFTLRFRRVSTVTN